MPLKWLILCCVNFTFRNLLNDGRKRSHVQYYLGASVHYYKKIWEHYGTIWKYALLSVSVKVQLNSFSDPEPHTSGNFASWEPSHESSRQSHYCADRIQFQFWRSQSPCRRALQPFPSPTSHTIFSPHKCSFRGFQVYNRLWAAL